MLRLFSIFSVALHHTFVTQSRQKPAPEYDGCRVAVSVFHFWFPTCPVSQAINIYTIDTPYRETKMAHLGGLENLLVVMCDFALCSLQFHNTTFA